MLSTGFCLQNHKADIKVLTRLKNYQEALEQNLLPGSFKLIAESFHLPFWLSARHCSLLLAASWIPSHTAHSIFKVSNCVFSLSHTLIPCNSSSATGWRKYSAFKKLLITMGQDNYSNLKVN